MRTPSSVKVALLLAGSLALAAAAASAATVSGRASARIVAPAKVAVTSTEGWSASVRAHAEGRVVETTFAFQIDRPRDYAVGVRLEKDDAPLGTSRLSWAESRVERGGLARANRLRAELPEAGDEPAPDKTHVRIILHNY